MEKVLFGKWMAYLKDPKNQTKQATGVLQSNDDCRNCCLGVAANICRVKHVKEAGEWVYHFKTMPHAVTVPPNGWQGMSEAYMQSLIKMNDELGKTFREIAAAIEASVTYSLPDDEILFDDKSLMGIVDYLSTIDRQNESGMYRDDAASL